MEYLLLFQAVFKKEFIIWKRYIFNSIGGFITIYIVFLFLFLGYSGLAADTFNYGEGLGGLMVGYILWTAALMTYQEISYQTLTEAQEGTLEQLYMSPFGYPLLAGLRLLASFFMDLIMIGLLLGAMLLTTKKTLNLDVFSLMPLFLITMLGIAGIGFIFGGITIVFKRIQNYLQIVQFLLIGLVAAPVKSVPLLSYLPASLGFTMIRDVMVKGYRFSSFPLSQILFLLLNSSFYLLAGLLIFRLCERYAMRQGLLGHY